MGARTCATSVSLQTAGVLQRSWAGHRQPTMCQGSLPLVPATLASTLHVAAAWWSGARASRRLGWTLLCQRTCVRRVGVPYMMMNVQHKHHDEKGSTRYSVVMKWSNYNYSRSVEKVIKKCNVMQWIVGSQRRHNAPLVKVNAMHVHVLARIRVCVAVNGAQPQSLGTVFCADSHSVPSFRNPCCPSWSEKCI